MLLAITLSISALFLTACNDDDDDYTGIDTNKAYVSESNYAIDKVDNASTIKVMTYNMANVQGKTATATAMVLFPKSNTTERWLSCSGMGTWNCWGG